MKMNFDEFKEYMKEYVKEFLPDDKDVFLDEVVKNNNITLTGIIIKGKDEKVVPCIYLEGYYVDYMDGMGVTEIAKDILKKHEEGIQKSANISNNFVIHTSFKDVKDKIVPRLVNLKKNIGNLDDRPFKEVCDLAIIFIIVVDISEEGVAHYPVNNTFMEEYNLTVDELYDLAIGNMKKMFPSKVEKISEFTGDTSTDEYDIYIITNELMINGATNILDCEVMEQLKNKIGEDVILLPSSICEFIATKRKPNEDNLLLALINEMNETNIAAIDYLSDSIYTYDFNNNELICI